MKIKEWVLLFFSLLLSFGGALGLLRSHSTRDWFMCLNCTVFFGLCALVFGRYLWNQRQSRAMSGNLRVTLTPGVPLYMKRGRLFALGGGIFLLGILIFLAGWFDMQFIMELCGAVTGLGGAVLVVLLATGKRGKNYLLFEKTGLRYGDPQGSYLLEWTNIRGILPGEYQHNQVVRFWVRDPEALARTGTGGSKAWTRDAILKSVGSSNAWQGCDWMLLTGQYGLNAVLLAQAVATYVTDPSVREGLEEHLKLAGS